MTGLAIEFLLLFFAGPGTVYLHSSSRPRDSRALGHDRVLSVYSLSRSLL